MTTATTYENLTPAVLVEHAIRHGDGYLTASGSITVITGDQTGRSPDDKFIVREPDSSDLIWWGEVNQPLDVQAFTRLAGDVHAHLNTRPHYIQRLAVGADPRYRTPVRVKTESAWSALFARNLFLTPDQASPTSEDAMPAWTVLHAPSFVADPDRHGTRSETAIVISFAERLVVITGTAYAGEIKKAMFSVLQFTLPPRDVATLHCSANAGESGDVTLFFGLSGTGKTTLSMVPDRTLIGDDEHGWTDTGIFNFEGGSYAKVISLSKAAEPTIWRASHRFGTVLENVRLEAHTREPQFDDDTLTENTRAAFPLTLLSNASPNGMADHPRNLVFLTADAFGVLPPVARLTPEQAVFWFLTGYTAKLAGTERGVGDPTATFSACFGSPFLPLPPMRYAELLGNRLRRHHPHVWLLNTGWSGGPAGTGERMPIPLTRAMVRAILDGSLAEVPTRTDAAFGLEVPTACPDVPPEVLQPRESWADPDAYDRTARRLSEDILANFAPFASGVPDKVASAGPRAFA